MENRLVTRELEGVVDSVKDIAFGLSMKLEKLRSLKVVKEGFCIMRGFLKTTGEGRY